MVPSPPEASFGSGVFLGIDEYYPGPKTNPRFSPKSCLAVEFWADLSPPIPAYPHPRPVLSLAHNPLPRPRVLSPSPTKPSYRQHARQSARAAGRAEPRRAARTAAGKGAAGGARAAGGAEHLTRQRQPWIPPSRSTPLPFLESDRRRHLPPFRYSVLPPLRNSLAFSPVNSFSDELPPSWDRVTTPIFVLQ